MAPNINVHLYMMPQLSYENINVHVLVGSEGYHVKILPRQQNNVSADYVKVEHCACMLTSKALLLEEIVSCSN